VDVVAAGVSGFSAGTDGASAAANSDRRGGADDTGRPPGSNGAAADSVGDSSDDGAAAELGTALAPLRDRYIHWLRLDADQVLTDRDEAAQDVRAMQLVLRMERADPPSWHRALASAATAAAAICLDQRSEPGGEWHEAIRDYCLGHIRKVTRRARGAHWAAAQDLPGITVDIDGTQLRALVPGRVTELDPRISRLQVGGTDVPVDDPPAEQVDPDALTVWLSAGVSMTLGKAMAQAGHAGMIAAALLSGTDQPALRRWRDAGCPAVGNRAESAHWAELTSTLGDEASAWRSRRLLAVRDAGFTEVAPGTVTVIGRAPKSA
jgi:peptidyl-tRNA hydrolase